MFNIYKVLSVFLSYPSIDLKNDIYYINDMIKNDKIVLKENSILLHDFFTFIDKNDILFLQEHYVSIFDRRKDCSLYIFEHIHGDSRERGMAMIDLLNLYKKSNFIISSKSELPDHIPVFLEYLSLLPDEKASLLLGEIINIVSVISKRLIKINTEYQKPFAILENLSPVKCDDKIVDKLLKESKFNINDYDKEWEEPKVF